MAVLTMLYGTSPGLDLVCNRLLFLEWILNHTDFFRQLLLVLVVFVVEKNARCAQSTLLPVKTNESSLKNDDWNLRPFSWDEMGLAVLG